MSRTGNIDAAASALARMAAGEPAAAAEPAGPIALRRWDSAKTHRLNSAHWQDALEQQPINADIAVDLPTLMARCAHEAANNPILEGVIETWVSDYVGPGGPILQVESDNDKYSNWLEARWAEWWAMPDIEGQLAGFEVLDLWGRMLWKAGAYLYRFVDDTRPGQDVSLRLRQYHPRKLATPYERAGDPNYVMGVESDQAGRILAYWLDRTPEGQFVGFTQDPERVTADLVRHRFRVLEPGQRRGVPWASSTLQVLADIRNADNEILDAIRAAADSAAFLEATGDQVDFLNVNESTSIERRTLKTLPPGWSLKTLNPAQPHTNYLTFRDERVREIGRVVGMPLLIIKGDAGRHNYSSARFDERGYWRNIEKFRHTVQERDLSPMVRMVERETRLSQLSGGARVPRPKRFESVKFIWNWPQPPKLDLQKEWSGHGIMRALGSLSFDDMIKQTGRTREQYLAQEKRARADFDEAGIPYPEPEEALKALLAYAQLSNNQQEEQPAQANSTEEVGANV